MLQSADIQAALDKTIAEFGRLDYAFNNAGVEQEKTPLADLDEAEWERIVNTDLRGVFLCMKHEIPLLLKQGGGAIVNTSSGAGVPAGTRSNGFTVSSTLKRRPSVAVRLNAASS